MKRYRISTVKENSYIRHFTWMTEWDSLLPDGLISDWKHVSLPSPPLDCYSKPKPEKSKLKEHGAKRSSHLRSAERVVRTYGAKRSSHSRSEAERAFTKRSVVRTRAAQRSAISHASCAQNRSRFSLDLTALWSLIRARSVGEWWLLTAFSCLNTVREMRWFRMLSVRKIR